MSVASHGVGAGKPRVTNEDVASTLERVGDLLEVQEANPFRVRAYRGAAATVRDMGVAVADLLREEGREGLCALPGIGEALARAIQELVDTGRLRLLQRLEGQICPEDLFRTVPGIGKELAHRIRADLDIDTLEELELAAHDGRLRRVTGFGPRRVRGVRDSLAGILGRAGRLRSLPWRTARAPSTPPRGTARPSVADLLSVDAEYRREASEGSLPRIAPRRFNPAGEAWLPVLHTERDGWYVTALFSNTARAHDLERTHDWVVIYADGQDGHEQRFTVVTEYLGDLAGQRVVRGREAECRTYYLSRDDTGVP